MAEPRKANKPGKANAPKEKPDTTPVRLLNKSAENLYSLAELKGTTAADVFDFYFGAELEQEVIALTEARLERLRKDADRRKAE